MATITSPNKRFNEQYNDCARTLSWAITCDEIAYSFPFTGADLGGECRGCALLELACGFLIQLVFCKKS